MIVLDQHIPVDVRLQLRATRTRCCFIGVDIGWPGMDDVQDILPLLRRVRRPTFFTRDGDFFLQALCHPDYCLVMLAVSSQEAGSYILRFLRHPEFRTWTQRAGKVVRVSSIVLAGYQFHSPEFREVGWA